MLASFDHEEAEVPAHLRSLTVAARQESLLLEKTLAPGPPIITSRHCSLQVFSLVLMLFAGLTPAAFGQGLDAVRAEYTKYEYRIPMRDGTKLFTAVYVPKDLSQRYPILLVRTPYSVSPYGVDRFKNDLGPSPLFGKAGYIFEIGRASCRERV